MRPGAAWNATPGIGNFGAFCTVRHESRNDNINVLGGLLRRQSIPHPHPHQATSLQPHQKIAARGTSRSTCLLFAYLPSTARPICASNQSCRPFWEQECLDTFTYEAFDNVDSKGKSNALSGYSERYCIHTASLASYDG